MVVKKLNKLESAQKIYASRVDVKCMHTNFDGHGFIGFRDIATFKYGQISLSDHGHGSEKIESIRIGSKNLCK